MTLHYLSTGDSLILETARARRSATFSPDGKRIAYFVGETADSKAKNQLYTSNIDGSNRKKLKGNIGHTYSGIRWATNGFIYWHGPRASYRIPENGGSSETVHTMEQNTPTPKGGTVDPSNSSWQFSADGSRSIGTGQRYKPDGGKAGWAQLAINQVTGEQFSPIAPCQGSISPDGEIVSASHAGHRVYRFSYWDIAYKEYFDAEGNKVGDTFDGCTKGEYKDHGICPDYDTVLWIGPDLNTMFSIGSSWSDNPEIGSPRFSSSTGDIFMFTTRKPVNEQSNGSWLYDFTTHEYTKVGPAGSDIQDYYHTEITVDRSAGISPSVVHLSVDETGTASSPVTVSLYSPDPMSGPPTISEVPAWLTVTADVSSDNEYLLECAVLESAVPEAGSYEAAVSIVPPGATESIGLTVVLNVKEASAAAPIVIHRPRGGETFTIGDTIHVEFTSDTTEILGTLLSLSVDGGKSFWLMTEEDSYESGENVTFDYVIPSQLVGNSGTPQSVVSDQCLVMVSNYPEGHETQSGRFTITEPSGSSRPAAHRGDQVRELTAIGRGFGSGIQVIVGAPSPGTARLLDLGGRLVHSFTLAPGHQLVTLPSVKVGRYVLEASYANGQKARISIDAY